MRKIKLLQLNWYRLLTIAFLVLLFAVSRVEAVYIPKDNGDISTFTTTFLEKAKTIGLNSFKDTTSFVKTTLNTANDAIVSSLDTYKDIFSQTQIKSSSLASVGSSLTSISDGLAYGWKTFTYGILNNIVSSVNGTKEFVVSVLDGAKFVGNEIGASLSSGFNSLSTSLSDSLSFLEPKPKVITETKVITPTVIPTKQEEVIPPTTTIINQIAGTGPEGERGSIGPVGPEGSRGSKGEKGDTPDTSSFVLNSFLENQVDRILDSISDNIDDSSNRITEDGTLNDSILNRPVLNNATGTLIGTLTGNADTVTNGLYSTGSYSNPTWLTAIPYSILSGTIPTWNQDTTGNAGTVTNGIYSTGSYSNPTWLTAIPYSILSGTVPTWNQDTTGNAGTVTNGLYSTGSYSDPLWLTISKSKVGLSNVDNTSDATKSVLYSASSGDSGLLDGNDSTYFYQASNPTGFITSSGTATNFSGSLAGDVTGTQGATVVGDDTHSHTASTISGLSVSNFTSPNISNWTNDSAYINAGSTLTGLVQSTATGIHILREGAWVWGRQHQVVYWKLLKVMV